MDNKNGSLAREGQHIIGGQKHQKGELQSLQPFMAVDLLNQGSDESMIQDDFNLKANLLDLSRISMGQQDLSVIKDKEINQDQVNESMVQDTLQIMMSESRKQLKNKKCEQKPPLKPRKSGVLEQQHAQTQLQPQILFVQQDPIVQVQVEETQPPSCSDWKKVNIVKKKRFSKKTEPQEKDPQKIEVVIDKQDDAGLDLNDIQIDIDVNQQRQTTQLSEAKQPKNTIMSKAGSKNKYATEAEPLPLFDCLYCIGIHEHLALQTQKEKQLNKLYGQEPLIGKLKAANNDQTYAEFNAEFYENVRHLEKIFTVEMLHHQSLKRSGPLDESQEALQASSSSDELESVQLKSQLDFIEALSLGQNSCQKFRPLQPKIDRKLKQIALIKEKQQKAHLPEKGADRKEQGKQVDPQHLNSDDSFDSQLASNILGGFNDIDSEEQSMFINLNIRNRRQKILHNISFESQFYDIFNPDFTSDEDNSEMTESRSSLASSEMAGNSASERSSASLTSSGEKSSSSQSSSQDSLQLNQGTKKNAQNKWSCDENMETRFPELDASQAPDRTIELNKQNKTNQTKLKEQDLDYNSENNRSSLSSIHREIQEAPQPQETRNNKLDMDPSNGEMETGGCQVEEMQNDTAVNECNFMLANKGRLGEDSESFSRQIKKEREHRMHKQLNQLGYDKHLVLQNEVCEEERSDLEDLDSEGLDDLAEVRRGELGGQGDETGKSSGREKKATGRFSNFPLNSEKSSKHQGTTSKKAWNPKMSSATDAQHIFLTQQEAGHQAANTKHLTNDEDDSIIKILPGLPSGESHPEQPDEATRAGQHKKSRGRAQKARTHPNRQTTGVPHPKSLARDSDCNEEASSLSSGAAAAGLYHHGGNLVLQTSPGKPLPQPQAAITTGSPMLDTDEDEDNTLLSPILTNQSQQQHLISIQTFNNLNESPENNQILQQQLFRNHLSKSKMQSPSNKNLTSEMMDAQQWTVTTLDKLKVQNVSSP